MPEHLQLSNSHYFFAFLVSKTAPRPHGIEKLFNPSSADYLLPQSTGFFELNEL